MTDQEALDLSNHVLADWQTALYAMDLHLTQWRQKAVDGEYPTVKEVAQQTAALAHFLCAGLTVQKRIREGAFQ